MATSGFVHIDGVDLEYLDLDTGECTPQIVMLHEGLGSVSMWRDFPEKLMRRTGHAVFAYSRRGHGQSSPIREARTPDYMHREAIDVLPKVLTECQIDRPVLFGHSDGGSIALIYAATYPETLSAVVLEAPHVFVEELSVRSITAVRETALESDFLKRLGKYHHDPANTFWTWNDIWLAPEFREWSIVEMLPRITCPILLIQGRDDEYGTQDQLQAISGGVDAPVEIRMLDNCGHSAHRDREGTVLDAVDGFLRRYF